MVANSVENPTDWAARTGRSGDHSVQSVGDQPTHAEGEAKACHPPVRPACISKSRSDPQGQPGQRQAVGGNTQPQDGRQKQPPYEVDEPDIRGIVDAQVARAVRRRNSHAWKSRSAQAAAATGRVATGSDASSQSVLRRSRGLKKSRGSFAQRMLRWTQMSAIRSVRVGILPPCLLSQLI
jgi:hypothetical protein